MKNTFGESVTVTLFGESHGPEIGVVVDGLAPGIEVDEEYIASRLEMRRPNGQISTARKESDPFRIVSGVWQGKTTGTPVCILIPNQNTKSSDYSDISHIARPGHADYTGYVKYHGYNDPSGGGHFSGRLTAPLVAAGAIVLEALKKRGILIGTHVARCAGIPDKKFNNAETDIKNLENKPFAVLDDAAGQKMQEAILKVSSEGDSVGGILETVVTGIPAGVGEPWFGSVESELSSVLFGIPAVKGVAFGDGFGLADMRGSEANDPLRMEDGQVVSVTNHNGGINGGITNGMPIRFSCVIKPTPSIYKEQQSVDFVTGENADLQIKGRHDPAIIHRARVVVDCVTALVVSDLLAQRYGTDWLAGD